MTIKIKKNGKPSAASKSVKASKTVSVEAAKHEEAKQYIRSAIAVLCKDAKNGDSIAKDSIANLGVILMDLR